MNITLKQLHVFLAVARHENLGHAAKDLFVTRGAVSQALHELEKQLGVLLFDRDHPRIRLNREGKRLRPLADEMLRREKDIGLLFAEGGVGGLSVGASKTIGSYIMPGLLRDFKESARWLPDAHIGNSRELCDMVASFALDVALLEGEAHHPDLVIEDWLADQMVVVVHKDHPLAQGGPYRLTALRGEKWILREPDSGSREYFEYNLGPLIAPFEVAFSLSSPESILGLVEQGMGITFTSRIIAERRAGFTSSLAVAPLEHAFPRTLSICWHAKKYHSASMDAFVRFCLDWKPSL